MRKTPRDPQTPLPALDFAAIAASGAAAGLVYFDATHTARWMNTAAGTLLGIADIADLREPSPLLTMFVDVDGRPVERPGVVVAHASRTGTAGPPVVLGRRLPDDATVWIEASGRPVLDAHGTVMGVVVSFVDVSDRVAAHRDARTGEAELQSIFQAMNDGLVVRAASGAIIACNPAAERILGVTANQIAGRTSLDPRWAATHEDGSPFTEETRPAQVALRTGQAQRGVVMSVHKPDGTRTLISINAVPIWTGGPTPAAAVATFIDITPLRAAERRSQSHSRNIAAMLDNEFMPIVRLKDRRIQWQNGAAARLFGYEQEELLGQPTRILYASQAAFEAMGVTFYRQLREAGTVRLQQEMRHKDGRMLLVDIYGIPFADGLETLLFLSDVTAIRDAERRFQAALKMESIGRLAGGMAHELNNMLQTIGGSAALLREETLPGSFADSSLRDIETGVHRSAALVRQLTTYAGRQIAIPKDTPIDGPVGQAIGHIRSTLPASIHLKWTSQSGAPTANVDATLLEQAVTNLLTNARDAIQTSGTLSVRTGAVSMTPEPSPQNPEARSGSFVFVSVSDDGCGMTPDVRAHAFEPFFTTQQFGGNHGLGLASVYGMALQAGGWVTLDSATGVGTTATVYLPRTPATESADHATNAAALPPPTVVVVETEPSVRRITELMVSHCGYEVIGFARGADVVAMLRSTTRRVDILFTAAILPDMDAGTLAAAVQRLRPTVAVLCTSSYTHDVLIDRGALRPGDELLPRPFSSGQLARALTRLVQPAPPASDPP